MLASYAFLSLMPRHADYAIAATIIDADIGYATPRLRCDTPLHAAISPFSMRAAMPCCYADMIHYFSFSLMPLL